jgi:3-phenylpropionate/cinnamic acid dioxygenase small subunit
MDARTESARISVSREALGRIERFLFREASLLDRREYAAWQKILTDDIQYTILGKVNRDASVGSLEFSLMNENASQLKQRLDQISTPKLTHAENPPSITRRFITNVIADHGAAPSELEVTSNLLIYRTTIDAPEGAIYSAQREDLIREFDGEFQLARRVVHLDQAVMFGAISILF